MTHCPFCGGDPTAKITTFWFLETDLEIQSGNQRIVNSGKTMGKYAGIRDTWIQFFMAQRINRRIPKATQQRRVTLARRYCGRQSEFDYDNLVTGFKPLVDAMAHQGLIVHDKPTMIERHYKQMAWPTSGTTILIEEFLHVRDAQPHRPVQAP